MWSFSNTPPLWNEINNSWNRQLQTNHLSRENDKWKGEVKKKKKVIKRPANVWMLGTKWLVPERDCTANPGMTGPGKTISNFYSSCEHNLPLVYTTGVCRNRDKKLQSWLKLWLYKVEIQAQIITNITGMPSTLLLSQEEHRKSLCSGCPTHSRVHSIPKTSNTC